MKKKIEWIGTVYFAGIPIHGVKCILEIGHITPQELKEYEENEKVVQAAEKIVKEFLNK